MQQKRSLGFAGWLRFSATFCLLATQVVEAESPAEILATKLKPEVSSYIVVVDGGSTASRAHAFFYKPRVLVEPESENFVVKRPITLPVELFFVDHSPGVSSFSGNRSGLAAYMKDLTNRVAKRLLDHDKHIPLSDVPIYFGATAGMRGLSEHEQTDTLEIIRQVFEQGPLYYGHPIQARVLAGEEEGVFGWLMENYHHGQICSDADKTVGVLDMGGESTQVSFMPQSYSPLAGAFAMHFGPFPGAIHMYSHSYMNFGLVGGFQTASAQLMTGLRRNENANASHLVHPCLPTGISWRVREGQFGVSTDSFVSRSDGPLTLEGQGQFEDCLTAAENVIVAAAATCTLPPCALLGVYQPSFEGTTFWLIGEYSNIWQLMGASSDHGPRLEALKSRAKSFCALSHAEQARELAKHPGVSTAEPALACWLAVWSYAFLTKGLHLPSNYSGLEIDLQGGSGWPQGAAIYHVNNYPFRVILGKEAKKFEKSEKHAMRKMLRGIEIVDSKEKKAKRKEKKKLEKLMKKYLKHAKREAKHGQKPGTEIPSTLLSIPRGGFMPEVSTAMMFTGAGLLVIVLALLPFWLSRRAADPEAPGLQPLLVASA